jgi:hypothetical protein
MHEPDVYRALICRVEALARVQAADRVPPNPPDTRPFSCAQPRLRELVIPVTGPRTIAACG